MEAEETSESWAVRGMTKGLGGLERRKAACKNKKK